jgi:hypothetical protein
VSSGFWDYGFIFDDTTQAGGGYKKLLFFATGEWVYEELDANSTVTHRDGGHLSRGKGCSSAGYSTSVFDSVFNPCSQGSNYISLATIDLTGSFTIWGSAAIEFHITSRVSGRLGVVACVRVPGCQVPTITIVKNLEVMPVDADASTNRDSINPFAQPARFGQPAAAVVPTPTPPMTGQRVWCNYVPYSCERWDEPGFNRAHWEIIAADPARVAAMGTATPTP